MTFNEVYSLIENFLYFAFFQIGKINLKDSIEIKMDWNEVIIKI